MAKKQKIEVEGVQITITERNNLDFISLTDIANGFEGGSALIEKWIRNKSTIEFLAVWERLNNPDFNSAEFEGIRMEAGSNRFVMSAKQWTEKTKAIGIVATAGRYGGTFAHKDIAIEFCAWLSPEFKLLLIHEFQRLKQKEAALQNEEWDFKRFLAKVNYRLHTDAIKKTLIPANINEKDKEHLVYADEADLLNLALFGITAKQWKEQNSKLFSIGLNIRDTADLHQLTVLSNLESYNAIMIQKNIPKLERLEELRKVATQQLSALQALNAYKLEKLKRTIIKQLEQKNKDDKEN